MPELIDASDVPLPLGPLRTLIVGNMLGPLYIAIVIFAALFGVSTVQAVLYFQHSQKDHILLKCVVLGLWVMDASLFGVLIYAGWCTFVSSAGALPALLASMSWILGLWYTMAGTSDLVVTCVMIWMSWSLASKKTWLLVVMVVPTIAALAGVIRISFLSFRDPLSVPNKENAWAWQLPFVSHAFVDLVVCVTLTSRLIRMHTGLANSDFVIRLLIVWFVNSGFLASALCVASIIVYAQQPNSFACDTVASVLSKVMFNSLLGLLNTREYRKRILCERAPEFTASAAPTAQTSPMNFVTARRSCAASSVCRQDLARSDALDLEAAYGGGKPRGYCIVEHHVEC